MKSGKLRLTFCRRKNLKLGPVRTHVKHKPGKTVNTKRYAQFRSVRPT